MDVGADDQQTRFGLLYRKTAPNISVNIGIFMPTTEQSEMVKFQLHSQTGSDHWVIRMEIFPTRGIL